jgi:hypothetical protein
VSRSSENHYRSHKICGLAGGARGSRWSLNWFVATPGCVGMECRISRERNAQFINLQHRHKCRLLYETVCEDDISLSQSDIALQFKSDVVYQKGQERRLHKESPLRAWFADQFSQLMYAGSLNEYKIPVRSFCTCCQSSITG